jgi:hypothetical protein
MRRDDDRPAADAAVLDVLLGVHGGIHEDLDLLPAIGALDER